MIPYGYDAVCVRVSESGHLLLLYSPRSKINVSNNIPVVDGGMHEKGNKETNMEIWKYVTKEDSYKYDNSEQNISHLLNPLNFKPFLLTSRIAKMIRSPMRPDIFPDFLPRDLREPRSLVIFAFFRLRTCLPCL